MTPTRWYENPKFQIMDTWEFRVAYSLLVIGPFVEVMVGATMHPHHTGLIWLPVIMVYAWMIGIFAIMVRQTRVNQLQVMRKWEDE